MTNKETILKTIDFIEANIKTELSVLDIAREGCYSLYHFIRLFQNITHISPSKYLLQRRLTEAVYELRDTNKNIADIAYDYQFGSHESFTRAFRNYFGISPSKIRNGHSITSLPLFSPITKEYIYRSEVAHNHTPELVNLNERILVGISFFVPDNVKLTGLDKEWGQFMNAIQNISNKIYPERLYQVQFWSDSQDLGGLYFYIGVEVSELRDVDPQFVIKIIPRGRYLKFIHKGMSNKVGYTYRYIYNQYIPQTDYKLNKSFNFEFYGEKCMGPYNENSESEIYIPVE